MHPDAPIPKAAQQVIDSGFAAVVRLFMSPANPKWAKYAEASRDLWSRELLRASHPDCLGAIPLHDIRPSLVQAYLDGFADRPGKQAAAMAALKLVEKWAIVRDRLPRPITTGVEIEDSDGGHTPWSEEDVSLVEKYGRQDFSRVVTLGANTGQRGSDLIRMGWSDIERFNGMDGINVVQKKTGRKVWVPITSALASAMAAWEKQPGPFLRKMDGHLWSRTQLTAAWTRHRDSNRELEPIMRAGLVLHGLRGHACVRLLRAGANSRQISDMVGMSEEMVKNYTKLSDQRENATAAVLHLERRKRDLGSLARAV